MSDWQPTACILCECNCGIEVRLGGDDGRRFERIRGDKAHPASHGYTCEKALRLDHYQNGRHRLTSPMRRRADGTYEEIDWDTAINEIADRFAVVRDTHGGESIFYYGGGGQGNHLGGSYSTATRGALGSRFRSSALAQEKTGEFWVNAKMLGTHVRGDFEHTEVAVFFGKNPWQSHSLPHARTTLKEIARDPARSLIVVDPRRTETAELADLHLQVRPGTDAWCLAAHLRRLGARGPTWPPRGWQSTPPGSTRSPPCCDRSTSASSPPSPASTSDLVARPPGASPPRRASPSSKTSACRCRCTRRSSATSTSSSGCSPAISRSRAGSTCRRASSTSPDPGLSGKGSSRTGPVAGAGIISGLVPCNVIAEEILTDHPARYRAMLVESGNPAHSLADSPRMREALLALDLLVVIDVSMTETARLAHYVLPCCVAVREMGGDVLQLRLPGERLPPPSPAARAAARHARRARDPCPPVRGAGRRHRGRPPTRYVKPQERGRAEFAAAFFAADDRSSGARAPRSGAAVPALGPTLPATRRRRGAVGSGAPIRADLPGVGRPSRVRHRARSRRGIVRRHHLVTVWAGVHGGRTGSVLDSAAH